MHILEIKKRAKDILLKKSAKNSVVAYTKTLDFRDKILKVLCAFANTT